MKIKLDEDLLPMKAHYFLFNAATASVVPFMPTLARQMGFSPILIGQVYTILPVIGILVKPLFGFIADQFQRHRAVFIASQLITALAFVLMIFIPSIEKRPSSVELHCHAGVSELKYCSDKDVSQIEKELEDYYDNATMIACDLHCQAKSFTWDIMCKDWLANSTSCDKQSSASFNLTTFLSAGHIKQVEKCLYFRIPHSLANANGKNVTMYCPQSAQYFNVSCMMTCHSDFMNGVLTVSQPITDAESLHLYQFWWLFAMLVLSWIGMAVVVSVGDAICFSMLHDMHHLYGNQRLYGSVGCGIFSIITGIVVDKMSASGNTKDYTIAFLMTGIIMLLDIMASTRLKHTQARPSPIIFKDFGRMLLSLPCCVYFVWCVLVGLCTALMWNFLFWYLEDLCNEIAGCDSSIKTLEGFIVGIQCFGGELPFFILSGWILKKIGHINAMHLVLFAFGVRFLLYAMLTDPWLVLPIELLNGITFGIFYATMTTYASIVAPAGTEATIQGLVGAIFEGIGVSAGSCIAGILFSVVGNRKTFIIFGVGALFACALHAIAQYYIKWSQRSILNRQNGKKAPMAGIHTVGEKDINIPIATTLFNTNREEDFTEIDLNT